MMIIIIINNNNNDNNNNDNHSNNIYIYSPSFYRSAKKNKQFYFPR